MTSFGQEIEEALRLSNGSLFQNRRQLKETLLLVVLLNFLFFSLSPLLIRQIIIAHPVQSVEIVYHASTANEPRFIEANPAAEVVESVATQNFSSRSQQSAQEKPSDERQLDLPHLAGTETETQKIVQRQEMSPIHGSISTDGDHSNFSPEKIPPVLGTDSDQKEAALAQNQPVSPPDFLNRQKVNPDGRQFEVPPDEQIDPQRPPLRRQQASDLLVKPHHYPQPSQRPRIRPRVLAGEILRSSSRVTKIGEVAIDAKFSDFGDYLARLLEAISSQWEAFIQRVTFAQTERNGFVILEFLLEPDGQIRQTTILQTTVSRAATLICQEAIDSLSPVDPWTPKMQAQLGNQQPIRIKFHYH